MCKGKCKGGAMVHLVSKILLIIGGINWGLVGVGMLLGKDLNVVKMLLGSMPTLEAIVYILVGVAGLLYIFGCRCSQCKAACANCCVEDKKEGMM